VPALTELVGTKDAGLHCRDSPPLDTEWRAMQRQHEDFDYISNSRAIRTQIGGALREQHDLAEPLSESLVGLMERLETRVRHDAALERKYAAVEEALESMINLAQ
jgi:hypothetical protein